MTPTATVTQASSLEKSPLLFDEFFQLGQPELVSPFIMPNSRRWGANITLKASLIAAGFLVFAFILSFFPLLMPISSLMLVVVYFLAGCPALIEALEDLASFDINIDILMTLAAFSSVLIGSGMEGGLLLVLFSLSGSMEDYVTNKAKGDISNLHKLSPTKACVIEKDGTLLERSIKEIGIGTKILIRAGQVVPLDGIVTDGISSVNLVHLTGENLPMTKRVGDEVPAGARNLEGTLTVNVTRISTDSTVARIIQLVVQAQEEKPALQRWFDKLSRGYAIAIILLAALFAAGLPFLFPMPYLGVEGSIYRALAFLIAASPCALIIAIPIAYLSAIGVCARQGILLKGGITLDALARCSVIAFDKTGTLTTGDLTLEGIECMGECSPQEEKEALAIAYAMEKNAIHPIAKALTTYGQQNKLPVIALKEFKSIPGYGLSATAMTSKGEVSCYIGHLSHIVTRLDHVTKDLLEKKLLEPQERGEITTLLLIGKSLFLLRFQDTLRPYIESTIKDLQKRFGLRLVMLTGDHEQAARNIAMKLGIDDYRADLRPEDKLKYVSEMSESLHLAMIGDGINDAPALARASVGICMGKVGSTSAIDAAEVILLHDNIELLGWLMGKAHSTQRIVRENLVLSTLAILVASLPALAGLVPLWLAVVLHEGGTILVGLNGLRLLKK